MKVMMVQLPHFYDGISRPPTNYPLGIGYLVGTLKENHEFMPMDLWIDNSNINQAKKLISKKVPDIFCISVYSTQYPYFKELVSYLKETYPNNKIIAGGPGATFSYKVFLDKTKVDYCVIGEGEITLRELLDNLDNPGEVKGIAYRSEDSIVTTKKREQLKDLDSLPLPDREFFDTERYILNNKKEKGVSRGKRAANLIAGRGCPYSCTYCSKTFSGFRARSPEQIGKEVLTLKEKYKLDAVDFSDELVVSNKERVLKLCSILKDINIFWGCQGRINLMDDEMLKVMKDSRCTYIGYGVESFSQNILNGMKKQIKEDEIIPVIQRTKEYRIRPVIQYMYGFPGEDDSTINKTFEFFRAIDEPYAAFITTPLPGTELYDTAIKKNLIIDEEDYLNQLTSGYNRLAPLINLTDFSDEEFVIKRISLAKKINRHYYQRHSFIFLKTRVARLLEILKIFILRPGYFYKKLKSRI